MNDLRLLFHKYNLRIEKLLLSGNIKIVYTNNGKFVVKKMRKDSNELFKYLESKNFRNYLDYINDENDDFAIYPYMNSIVNNLEENAKDLILLVSVLHTKTQFYKSFSVDDIKNMYEENIEYISNMGKYYDNIRLYIEELTYIPPSKYFLLRNISWIFYSLNSSKFFFDKWYHLIKEKKTKRVCLIHGNLEFEHLINSDEKKLISWDNARNDVPIYDLICLYKKHYKDVSFYELLKLYEETFLLLEEERYFLFALMLLPSKLEFSNTEILNTKQAYDLINYLKVSNDIISNYHSTYSNS